MFPVDVDAIERNSPKKLVVKLPCAHAPASKSESAADLGSEYRTPPALGRLAQSATGLKNYVGILRGVETIVNSMAMHDHDNIMASNGCLAIARICHLPDIDSREDKELAQKALDTNAEIQEKALTEGALNAVLTAEVRHGASKLV